MNKIECDNLFPQRVWSTKLNLDCKKLEHFVYALEKQDKKGAKKSNANGWQSQSIISNEFNDDTFTELVDNIHDIVNACAESSKLPSLSISNLWFNINRGYCYNSPHTHPKSVFSGVFYIKANGNEGEIEFLRDDDSQNFLPELTEPPSFYTSHSKKYTPEANTLLVFGSWMKHWVIPNLTKLDRISVSFNTYVK